MNYGSLKEVTAILFLALLKAEKKHTLPQGVFLELRTIAVICITKPWFDHNENGGGPNIKVKF